MNACEPRGPRNSAIRLLVLWLEPDYNQKPKSPGLNERQARHVHFFKLLGGGYELYLLDPKPS